MFAAFVQDLHFTYRSVRREPVFFVISVLSLALGIGVNVSIVSFVNALFLRPLPGIPESGRLVSIYHQTKSGQFTSSSYPDYQYYREHSRSFSGILAYLRVPVMLRADKQTDRVYSELVSGNYFPLLGIKPALGRMLGEHEDAAVAVLSHEYWERNFAGDPGVVSRSVRIGSGVFNIIGVAPRGFRGIVLDWVESPSIWIPAVTYREAVPPFRAIDILGSWGMQSYELVGRLNPGIGFEQAVTEMAALGKRIQVDHPERAQIWSNETAEYRDISPVLYHTTGTRFWPGARDNVTSFLGLLAAVAFLILLIAYFNVANLVLMRTLMRRSELGIRLSMGAPAGRLLGQLLTENLVLTSVGGLAALLVGTWISRFLAGFHQAFRIPLDVDAGIDRNVLAFAAVLSVAAAIVLTFFAARLASKYDVASALKADLGSSGFQRMRANQALIVAQVSLSVLLLLAAGLFVRTLRNARAADVTVQSANVLWTALDLASRDYDDARGTVLYSQILERVRAVPGVRDAAFVYVVPLGGRRGGTNILLTPPGGGKPKPAQVGFNVITPGYFSTVGIPLVRGRNISDADRPSAPAVAVINEEMVRRMFSGQEPIGRQFMLNAQPGKTVEVEIVGVVRDGKFRNYRSELEPTVYVPLAQQYRPEMNLEVRTAINPAQLAGAIRTEVAALDKDVPLSHVATLKTHLDDALSQERLSASLLTGLGVLALVLAAIGVYGVLSNSVAQRAREVGIRMALGADERTVQIAVLAGAMRPVFVGLIIGLAAALSLMRLVKTLLYGISATDPFVYSMVVFILLIVAFFAAFIPARRAARTDPATVLRRL